MKKMLLCTGMLALLLCSAAMIIASDEKAAPASEQPAGMPPMGPPPEMKEVAGLVGNWNCTMKMKMDLSSDQWMETKMTTKCAYILDGAALSMEHQSIDPMMGMIFKGFGIETYDREKKQWQMTWTDNMSGRTSMYTGTKTATEVVMTGEDMMGGVSMLTRITTKNMTATSYDWIMDMSMDQGKTWATVGTAVYTKVK